MKQKTLVNEVEIGMYVSELDRAWNKVPFEPPFEVQGFVVSSEDDLNQIKKYCHYVFIDVPDEPLGVDRKRVITKRIEEKGALRNVRYVSSKEDSQLRQEVEHENKKVKTVGRRKTSQTGVTGTKISNTAKWWEVTKRPARRRPRRDNGKPQSGGSTIRYVDEIESSRKDNASAASRPDVMFVGSETGTPVYPVQSPIEEEIVVARDIVNDTFKVYENVVHDIQAGKAPNAEAVKQTVRGLVQSVIRNPDALTWLIKMKQQDNYTYYHSMATCIMALTIGRHLGLPKNDLDAMGTGTLLQDIGKIAIPKELLEKTGELTSAERKILRKHVETGLKMLDRQHDLANETMEIVRSHHERHDGSGYPKGIHSGLITPATTIAAMADTFQALTSDRPYRSALTSLDALTKMYELGESWFPQAMVEHLIQCVGPFPIGTFVKLNTGEIAVVISPNRILQLKPHVLVVMDSKGSRLEEPESIDLSHQVVGDDSTAWKITQVVDPEDYSLDPREFFL